MIKIQIKQLADIIYTLEENIEEAMKDCSDIVSTNRAQNEESVLKKSIGELKSDIEVLSTRNQETHLRIRLLEEECEESQANESIEEESEEDELQNESMHINQNQSNDKAI